MFVCLFFACATLRMRNNINYIAAWACSPGRRAQLAYIARHMQGNRNNKLWRKSVSIVSHMPHATCHTRVIHLLNYSSAPHTHQLTMIVSRKRNAWDRVCRSQGFAGTCSGLSRYLPYDLQFINPSCTKCMLCVWSEHTTCGGFTHRKIAITSFMMPTIKRSVWHSYSHSLCWIGLAWTEEIIIAA